MSDIYEIVINIIDSYFSVENKKYLREYLSSKDMWEAYPELRKLFKRILRHRSKCKFWKEKKPCFDCHYGLLTKIEEEIGVK